MLNRICAVLALLVLVGPSSARAQANLQSDVADRVVAMVGDSTVLQSEVLVKAERLALTDSTLPQPTSPQFRDFLREVLDSEVDQLIIIQAAEKDTLIQVDEATIDQQIAAYIDGLARQFGGQPALQQALRDEMGMTLAEFREARRSEARREQIIQSYLANQIRNTRDVALTEEELRARFAEVRSQLQQRPRRITFRQVIVRPEASDSAKAAARAAIDSIAQRARAGEDFATLAREYSDDVGTASLGGDLGWFRRGVMVQEFEDMAFALGAGRMGIVESPLGVHLILVERTRGRSEVQARHILKIPEVSQENIDAARDVAREVAEQARNGGDMEELYDEYGDDSEPDSVTVEVPRIQTLPPAYSVLRTATAGDVLGPLEFQQGAGRPSDTRFSVVKVTGIREAGEYTFEDVRPVLAEQLQQQRKQERILERLRENTYIDIRM
ncbi:MAG: peptidylprolyl isomerase [Gemmatimonadota bacterium]|jgi:peptidyl-prolyl cis-trans isomerase SurA